MAYPRPGRPEKRPFTWQVLLLPASIYILWIMWDLRSLSCGILVLHLRCRPQIGIARLKSLRRCARRPLIPVISHLSMEHYAIRMGSKTTYIRLHTWVNLHKWLLAEVFSGWSELCCNYFGRPDKLNCCWLSKVMAMALRCLQCLTAALLKTSHGLGTR